MQELRLVPAEVRFPNGAEARWNARNSRLLSGPAGTRQHSRKDSPDRAGGFLRNFYKMKQDTFSSREIDIVLPDLGPETGPIRFIMWLVPEGSKVIPGERLAEICSQGIVFLLEAEHQGILQKHLARPEDTLLPGAVLGTLWADH